MPGKSPGPQVKNKDQYEALRDKGYSKEKSARISNSEGASHRGGKAKAYEDQTKKEVYEEAKKVGIEGRSKMSKKELVNALRHN
ncbi:MAG: Rho termination factor [Flavobacterium sp.]|nr:MAG: Rho termination factor [Flavobacterium sp.]